MQRGHTPVKTATSFIPSALPLPTSEPTRRPTLIPSETDKFMIKKLSSAEDCKAPCFWGIIPGKTKYTEALALFQHLGLKTYYIDGTNAGYFGFDYDLTGTCDFGANLRIKEGIVDKIVLYIGPTSNLEPENEWRTYTIDTLIKEYGTPSRVGVFLGSVAPTPGYEIVLYYDDIELIAEYDGDNQGLGAPGEVQLCPLTDQTVTSRIFLGKNPENPPFSEYYIKDVTDLSLKEFSDLMTGDKEKACFDVTYSVFP